MTLYRPPALDKAAPIVGADGRITPYFQRFWQNLSFTAADGGGSVASVAALQSQIGTINGQIGALSTGKAPVASPALTGTPTAPTAGAGASTTQIATTAFVQGAVAGRVARATFAGWSAATGTAARSAFATYDAPVAAGAYDPAQMQAAMDALETLSRRMKALIDDLKS